MSNNYVINYIIDDKLSSKKDYRFKVEPDQESISITHTKSNKGVSVEVYDGKIFVSIYHGNDTQTVEIDGDVEPIFSDDGKNDNKCLNCSRKFIPKHPSQKFCSNYRSAGKNNCKDRYWNHKRGYEDRMRNVKNDGVLLDDEAGEG